MNDADQPDGFGTTPLYAAAVAGKAATVRALLAAGADANRESAGDSDGTPLCGAACWGYEETVRALLEGGADPNQAECDGSVPLEWAARGMHHGTAVALLEAGADPNHPSAPLVIAADRGSVGLVRLLLAHGADPSLPDVQGRTALAAAEAKDGVNIARLLTEQLAGDGPVEVRRELRAEGSERIEVYRATPNGGRRGSASENGHAQIVALLRNA
jgi:ankyrin repeat protein